MSEKADAIQHAKNTQSPGGALRAEFPLLIGLGTAAIFLVVGSDLNELTNACIPPAGCLCLAFCRDPLVCRVRGAACRLSCDQTWRALWNFDPHALRDQHRGRNDFHGDVTRR